MQHFQGIVFIWTQTDRKIFKAALVYLQLIWPNQEYFPRLTVHLHTYFLLWSWFLPWNCLCISQNVFFAVDTRRRFNVYTTSIRRHWRRIDVLLMLKRRHVSTGFHAPSRMNRYWVNLKASLVNLRTFPVAATFLFLLLKKRLLHRCLPVNFAKFLRTSFL